MAETYIRKILQSHIGDNWIDEAVAEIVEE